MEISICGFCYASEVARIGCPRKGASYSGTQCLAPPLCGAKLLKARQVDRKEPRRQSSPELVAAGREGERKCRGGKLFGLAEPCPACGAKLREERAKVCGFCYAPERSANWLPQEERGKGSAGAASYSDSQCLAPLAGQNSVKIAPKGYNPNFLLITGDWFGFTFLFSEIE